MTTEDVNTTKPTTTEHAHGENCDHEHEHDHDDHDKSHKSEKKTRKAIAKLGMTKMEGVNRVTLRQKDNYILIVKDPEVYHTEQSDNAFVIFGELSFDDPDKKFAKEEMDRIRAEGEKLTQETTENKDKVEIVADENEEVSEEGLDGANIETVMNECKVSRQKAVKALKSSGNDVVSAILSLNA